MPGHPEGSFCWVELGTTDERGASSFYSSLFGWSAAAFPIGENEYRTMFRLKDGDAAAAYTMRSEERSMSGPHWNLYVAVHSADATAQHARQLGGTLIAPPFDVMTFGRMAVILDPAGAPFCIWEPKDHPGSTVKHESGTFCWADLSTPDAHSATQFYEGLFGWKIAPVDPYSPGYLVIQNGEERIGGITPPAHRNPSAPPHWMLFFLVDDVDGLAAKAKALGGAQHLAPMSVGGARIAVLADPQGAAFSILRPAGK